MSIYSLLGYVFTFRRKYCLHNQGGILSQAINKHKLSDSRIAACFIICLVYSSALKMDTKPITYYGLFSTLLNDSHRAHSLRWAMLGSVGLLYQRRALNKKWQGKRRVPGVNLHSAKLIHTNPTELGLGSNPGHHEGSLRLSDYVSGWAHPQREQRKSMEGVGAVDRTN
jgi:hypothetical protein